MPKCRILPGKVRYSTYDVAEEAVAYLNSKIVGTKKPELRHFYCRHCDGYHITSQVKDYLAKTRRESKFSITDWFMSILRQEPHVL